MLDGLDAAALERRMLTSGSEARAVIAAAGIPVERIDVALRARHALSRPDPHRRGAAAGRAGRRHARGQRGMIREAFEAAYLASFSRLLPGLAIAHRVAARRRDRPPAGVRLLGVRARSRRRRWTKARLGTRPVWFDGGWRDTGIWSRLDLPVGATIAGPAILEQPDATTVIEPGLAGRIDPLGNLIVERLR